PGNPPPNPESHISTVTVLYDDQPAGAADREGNPDDVKFTPDQAYNQTPGANGSVKAVAVQEDQKTVIVGDFTAYNTKPRNGVARLNLDGSLDVDFTPGLGADGSVADVAIYPGSVTNKSLIGKVVVVGSFKSIDGIERYGIARLNTNGTLDLSFSPG